MVVSKPSRMISSLQYPAASKLLCSNDLWSFQPSTSMVTSKDFSTQILIISLGLSDTSCKPSTLLHPHPGLICSNSPSPLPSDSSTFPQSLNQTAPHHGGMADHLDCRLWFLCTLTSHMTWSMLHLPPLFWTPGSWILQRKSIALWNTSLSIQSPPSLGPSFESAFLTLSSSFFPLSFCLLSPVLALSLTLSLSLLLMTVKHFPISAYHISPSQRNSLNMVFLPISSL